MPNVIATPRSLRNGEVITEFTDTTSTTAVTYTYPIQQAGISIENSGVADVFVTVGSYTNQLVKPNQTWKADAVFTSFSIRSNANSQEFTATAFQNDVEGSGEADSVAREMINNINNPRLTLSMIGAPLGSKFMGNSDDFVVPWAFYHMYSNRDKTTGCLYAIEQAYTGRTDQKIIKSLDGGTLWTVLGTIPVNIAAGERLMKLFVEPAYETFHIMKAMDVIGNPSHYNIVSYSYNSATSTFTLLGTLDIGNHKWLNSSKSIDSTYKSGLGTVTMFAEYGADDQTVMRVWRTLDKGVTWTVVFSQVGNSSNGSSGEIRHFHTLQVDPFTGTWWLSSGDTDPQCKVWTSIDNGDNWVLQDGGVGGSQDLRLIGFIFEANYIYYAMDTPQAQQITKIFRFTKNNLPGREIIGYQPENTSVRAITRTFFPAGFIVWPALEGVGNGGVPGTYVTPQFYDYTTQKMKNLSRFNTVGLETGGIYDASRYQCKFSGSIALELYGDVADNYAYDQFASSTKSSRLLKAQISM